MEKFQNKIEEQNQVKNKENSNLGDGNNKVGNIIPNNVIEAPKSSPIRNSIVIQNYDHKLDEPKRLGLVVNKNEIENIPKNVQLRQQSSSASRNYINQPIVQV